MIVDHLDYTWIFWLSLVVILGAVVATHFFVPETPVKTPARIDWAGAALLAAGLGSGPLAVSEGNGWLSSSPCCTTPALVSAAALGLAFAAALLIPRRAAAPVVPHGHERLGEPARAAVR